MKKVALHNLGCKVNAYETEAMAGLLSDAGYMIVPFEEKADVYIINTCSVTNIADRKSRQMLHKAKKRNPDAIVVAAGCYVQTSTRKAIEDEAIDIVVGNNKKRDIVKILDEYYGNHSRLEDCVIDINATKEYEDLEIATVTEHTRAHLKIQDGCNNFCSYCIIPYARGRIRSRKYASIIEEASRLAKRGFKEVVLSGINLSCYKDEDNQLVDVIEGLSNVEGIDRIRLGSLDPKIVTEDFVKRISVVKQFCPHFHLSMQSGCDKTLQAMNRHYTSEEYYNKCQLIRKYFDNPAFTTDVIVGFPDETDEDFCETKAFVEKVGFAELHVFKYSKRNGTVAANMDHQVNEKIKNQRSEELIAIGNMLTEKFRRGKLGENAKVLFEEQIEIDGIDYWIGHTKDYIKVAFPSEEILTGKILDITLSDFLSSEIMLATQ